MNAIFMPLIFPSKVVQSRRLKECLQGCKRWRGKGVSYQKKEGKLYDKIK